MKLLKKMIFFIIFIILIAGGILIKLGYDLYLEAITETSLEDKIKEIQSIDNYTKYDELPQDYINAVVAVEDKYFFKHHGINIISISRAVVIDIHEKSFEEGGSTITQQLAKNIYFTQEKKLTRKVAEIFMAYNIENNCT